MIQSGKLVLFCSLLALCVLSAPVDEIDDDDDDVELDDEQLRAYTDNTNTITRAASETASEPMLNKYKWPITNRMPYQVIVPIVIREKDYTAEALANFRAGLEDIENKTCVRFVDRLARHENYIFVHDAGTGKCNSKLGKVGGRQPLRFSNGCMLVRKKCVHEIIHALGFHHMHQRYDRDTALTIKWDNIEETEQKWFTKLNNEWEAYNTPYDEWSAMHYAKDAFSKNGKISIQTKDPKFQNEIGKQFTLSAGDAQRIVRMYKCPGQYWTH